MSQHIVTIRLPVSGGIPLSAYPESKPAAQPVVTDTPDATVPARQPLHVPVMTVGEPDGITRDGRCGVPSIDTGRPSEMAAATGEGQART